MQEAESQLVAVVADAIRQKLREYRRKQGPIAKALGADLDHWTMNLLEAIPQAVKILKQELQEKIGNLRSE